MRGIRGGFVRVVLLGTSLCNLTCASESNALTGPSGLDQVEVLWHINREPSNVADCQSPATECHFPVDTNIRIFLSITVHSPVTLRAVTSTPFLVGGNDFCAQLSTFNPTLVTQELTCTSVGRLLAGTHTWRVTVISGNAQKVNDVTIAAP
jgi:hypothetical protein